MARPIKNGLDYFPFDVNFMNSRIARRLKRQFDNDGLVVYMTVLCDTFANGYFIEVTDDYLFDLTEVCACDEKKLLEIIDYLVKLEVFHAEFWRQKRILTSQYIQECYIMAKRKVPVEHLISEDIRLVLPEKSSVLPEKPIVLPEKPIILPGKPIVLPSIIPQRKEKKRKEKESKEKVSKEKNILTTTTIACAREEFSLKSYHEELANDEEWQYSVVQASGKGAGILDLLPQVIPLFDAHIVSIGESGEIRNINDYKRRLVSWWRCMKFKTAEEIIYQQNNDTNSKYIYSAQPPQRLSKVDEMTETTKRAVEMAKQMLNL